ncbi:MAG TPA: histidine kinase dimerization/phospho-acceptor domain-containing protein [Terriglobales bacterium]|nr:histidine kinase dimerization/phospho-acceptor domain-containing protein [Terriglobales bacterium]
MSWRAKIWLIAACALVLVQAAGSLFLRQSFALIALSDVIQSLLLLSGALALLPNVLGSRGRARLFWALMNIGVFFWLVYQLLWTYFEVVLRRDVPNPFGGDVILFLHLVPMTAALALQPHLEHDERTTRLGFLDFTLLLVWWLYLYLFAVIPWQYVQRNAVLYEHNLNILYLTEKIVFLGGLVLSWWNSHKSWRTIYICWFVASLTYALSSYVANWAIERSVYYSGSLYDVPLVASIAAVTAIGLFTHGFSPKQRPDLLSSAYGVWVARVGMIAIFSLPLFAVWNVLFSTAETRIRTFRLALTLTSMLALSVLVFLRQHLLDLELRQLLRASQESFQSLQRLQTQLVQSERMASLGLLVGGAAHELNNPLTAMLGYSELLSASQLNPEQQAMAESIGQQVRRTKSLISSLLSFAKQVPSKMGRIDVNALIQTAIQLFDGQARDHAVRIHTDLGVDLPQILGDSNQLLQVCRHICVSLFDALAKTGGVFKVRTYQATGRVGLEFSADSLAIKAGETDASMDQSGGRETGAGLSACYGIVQEHNGTITQDASIKGCETIRIELPITFTQPASVAPTRSLLNLALRG